VLRVRFVLALLALLAAGCAQGEPQPVLPPSEPFGVAELTLRGPEGETVGMPVYVAADSAARSLGLMDRDELPAGTGMVFLFPSERAGPFYMYRTRIPLSIAFYGAGGRVLSVLDMEPCTSQDPAACERYDPGMPYAGALEVNQGFFAERGIGEGWTVELPSDLPSPGA
jgi:uncharacterized membrane protein (UPF0127 family)